MLLSGTSVPLIVTTALVYTRHFFSSWNVVVRQVVDEVAISIPPVTCHATKSCVASYEVSTFAAVVG